MRTLITITMMVLIAILTLGCAPGQPFEVPDCWVEKDEGPFGDTEYWARCKWETPAAPNFDALAVASDPSKWVVDVGSSNVQIVSFTGSGTVEKRSSNGSLVDSEVFNWIKVGNSLLISNPSSIYTFLNANPGQAVELEFVYKDILVSAHVGLNTIVVTGFYDGTAYGSEQESWYCNDEGQGFPDPIAQPECSY